MQTGKLANAVLDSIESQIAVIDRTGVICHVNQAWIDFGRSNGLDDDHVWVGTNYLSACLLAKQHGDKDGSEVLEGLTRVLKGELPVFSYEYPCHSPTEKRWFMMRILPVRGVQEAFVVMHHVITGRKLAEERVEQQNLELARLATTDKLTQLLNRLRLDELLEIEVERANRYRHPLSIIMIDIDFFKGINDMFGHRVGDQVLISFADLLRTRVRRIDSVGRWGGEEFLVLMPDSTQYAAGQLAEKLREATADHVFPGIGAITCSFGVAQYQGGQSISDFVERADSALYQAKRDGRNRVCLA